MELRHVRYFDAVAETLNFTRAAQRLHVTQSTLSHQIRQLEDELGVSLFDRSGKRVRMTEAGEMLRSYMAPALAQIDRGVQALRSPVDAITCRIRLGTTPSFNTRMIPRCVSTFLAHNPDHDVTVDELTAGAIAEGVANDHLDLAVSYKPANDDQLWFEPLYNEELRLVVSATHPLARRRRVRMIELNQMRMVMLPKGFATRQLIDECLLAAGASPVVVAQLNSIAPMLELVRQTQLAGIVTETAVEPSADLRVIPLENPTPIRTPGLLWKRGAHHSPTVRQFADIIRAAVGQPT